MAWFKAKHGICQLAVESEKFKSGYLWLSWYIQLKNKSHDLTVCKCVNCNETVLFWEAFPKKTLGSSFEISAAGYKVRKERISILICSNANGCHWLPLAVIDKLKNWDLKKV